MLVCCRSVSRSNPPHAVTVKIHALRSQSRPARCFAMASGLPETMMAIKVNENTAKVASGVDIPKVRPTYLLAKVDSIALNPTDWKHVSSKRAAPGCTSGCDFAGTVVRVGEGVSKLLKPGDRIAATTHGANFSQTEDGCFGEYCVAKADLVMKIPDNLKFEDAATAPLGISTVAQGLYQKALHMALPTDPIKTAEPVLIYGGSTATGSLGIQYAKLSGYKVLTTCSPRNNDFVKSLGADAVYDYKDPECGEKINKDTNNSLKLIWDTISLEPSAKICAAAMSSDPTVCKYGTILPVKLPRDGIETTTTFMYTIFGDKFTKAGKEFPPNQDDFEFAKMFFEMTERLLAEGKLKTHPAQVGEDGLEGALKGMEDLKNDKVSGKKLVYRVADTPKESTAEVQL